MIVTMITVLSIDGKLTHGDDPQVEHWASKEDGAHFASLRDQYDVIIMGRNVYERLHAQTPEVPGNLKIVMTSHPETFADQQVPGKVEFTNEQPAALVARLAADGHQKVLLTTGGQGNAAFLQAGVVDDYYVTIEPRIFGQGAEVVNNTPMDVQLRLIDTTRLNEQGSILLHYSVEKPTATA